MASLLSKIADYYLGHKYYAVILNRRRTKHVDLSSFIFYNREEAEKYFIDIRLTDLTYEPMQIVSFRSRLSYRLSWNEFEHARQTICTVPSQLPEVILPPEVRPYPIEEE